MNLPFLSACAYCGAPLAPAAAQVPAPPAAPDDSAGSPDLPPLLWTLVCLFLAIWGLIVAGPLRGLLGVLTNTYVLIGAALVSAVVTGMYFAERVAGQARPHALLSTRDLMVLSWTLAALLGASQATKYILPPLPVITRYEQVGGSGDGCRVEVYVKGEEGDEMWRLTGLSRKSQKEVVGIIVRRPGGGSARLPTVQHTPRGDCAIVKYHLLVNGKESDQLDGVGQ
jgi:hypothetical protein